MARAEKNEVKIKVRRYALSLSPFKANEITERTGLNPESVNTEIQRLKQKGFISAKRLENERFTTYSLSDDPQKRLELSQSIQAFFPQDLENIQHRPGSQLYWEALELLQDSENDSGIRQKEYYYKIKALLDQAWQTEGADVAPDVIKAYFYRDNGRLEFLMNEPIKGKSLFKKAKEIFVAENLDSESRFVDECRLFHEISYKLKNFGGKNISEKTTYLLNLIDKKETSPMNKFLVGFIHTLFKQHLAVKSQVAEAAFSRAFSEGYILPQQVFQTTSVSVGWSQRLQTEPHRKDILGVFGATCYLLPR